MMDPYKILGVSPTAAQDEVRKAYRDLAKKLHPDLNPGNQGAETRFKEIASAYELVGTADARAKFDRGETPEQIAEQQKRAYEQARAQQEQRGPFYHQTQQGGGRYSDELFENLFRQQRGNPRGDFAGEDQLYQMEVEFRESILGGSREITLPTGKRLQVKIPAGVEDGVKLRFKGQGGPGIGKGPAGDAYIEIHVRLLTGFKREGLDVETEVSVSFIEGLLGAEVQVPTLDGAVKLKIPPGVSTGSRLRIRGKGVADAKEPGDQIVVLKVVLPKKVDAGLAEAVRALGEKFSYNPRSDA